MLSMDLPLGDLSANLLRNLVLSIQSAVQTSASSA